MFKNALSQLFHHWPPSWADAIPMFAPLKPEVSCWLPLLIVQKVIRIVYISLDFHFRKPLAIQPHTKPHRLDQVWRIQSDISHWWRTHHPMKTWTPHQNHQRYREVCKTWKTKTKTEGTEVFECPGNCKEYDPCGSEVCNPLEELHITDDGVGTSLWAEDEEEVVHTRSPIIPTSKANFIAWNRGIEGLPREAIQLHVSNLVVYRLCKNCNCI
jgi:hypothetical protein